MTMDKTVKKLPMLYDDSAGEWVKCVVLDVDAPRGRVSLSLRQTRPDPLKQSLASILISPDGSTTVRSPCSHPVTSSCIMFRKQHWD